MEMSDAFRRIYNAVDRFFYPRAILREDRYSRDGGDSRLPKTAGQALSVIKPLVYEMDRQARLKMIVSQNGVNAEGASAHWEFFFNLTQRSAKVAAEWALSWDEAKDDYGPARIEIVIRPFPPAGSPVRQAVKDGELLHRQMISMWRQECSRSPDLPGRFRDTEEAIRDFLHQGLDIAQVEFSLGTGLSTGGNLAWIAKTRDASYYSPLE